ncbi:MAG TPA: AAA family ATPase [Chthoniobacterales bacterium]|nr:AAA family ATPase [Chthoniobacterales bacterium]
MHVKSLSLENVKAFGTLELDFERPDGQLKGWTVIVGGNSSGKTTILKAIALALCGPDAGRQLIKNTAGWIEKGAKGAKSVVEIRWDPEFDHFKVRGKLPGSTFPCGVRWTLEGENSVPDIKSAEFRSSWGTRLLTAPRGPWDPNAEGWFCSGYGPMRRLTGSSPDAMRDAVGGGKVASHVTLFREDAALSESEEWLKLLQFKQLEGDEEASHLVPQIIAFLNDDLLPRGFAIERITSEHVFVRSGKTLELPMRDLSDGCRSVYALLLDIIHNMALVFGTRGLFSRDERGRWVLKQPGVILIDEVEAHLHPAWQRTICDWLKTRFPETQFFVTTHSPLIVQAADPGGIIVLPLATEEGRQPRKLTDEEYNRVVLGKAEKGLLGESFGLDQTRGKWAVGQIAKYRLLDAKKRAGALNPVETDQYRELEHQMSIAFEDKPSLEIAGAGA